MPPSPLSIFLGRKPERDRWRLRDELEGLGYLCQEGQDALDVLRALREKPIDILVIDLQLPHLSGLELAQHLRADDGYHTLMIILLTDRNSDFIRPLSAALDVQLLPLPCSGAQIHQTIQGAPRFLPPLSGRASNEPLLM